MVGHNMVWFFDLVVCGGFVVTVIEGWSFCFVAKVCKEKGNAASSFLVFS